MANHWLYPSIQKKLSLRVDSESLKKLRRIAKQKNKTLTQSIEEWIDRLKKEQPSREGRDFRPIISGNLTFWGYWMDCLPSEKMGRNPVLWASALYFWFTTALGLVNWVYFCIALSTGQLPPQIFQSCTHSILLFSSLPCGVKLARAFV